MINVPLVILLLILGFFVYFTPYFVSAARNHRQKMGIFVLNLMLGWTFIFWVVALSWALMVDKEK